MSSSQIQLLVAAILFVGSHFGVSSTPLRPRLVAAVGERAYLAMYSTVQIVLLFWLIATFRAADTLPLWAVPGWVRHLPTLLMPVAFVLVIAGVATPNPTAVTGEAPIPGKPADIGIFRVTRHPAMWGIALWAGSHLAVSGETARLLFFGAFFVLATVGTVLIDQRKRESWGAAWAPFAAATSNVPFAAILAGRTRVTLGEIGWRSIGAGFAAAVLVNWYHGTLFGVSLRP
ncbi:MAG: hypothetical protein EXQ96_06185 [Alphaproteobacteria bacterium]|nr:hypothetical protein [Alphaproteobacteria bacterium]